MNNIIGLNYHTELLESLNWDEEEVENLVNFVTNFLDSKTNPRIEDIANLLEIIEEKWSLSQRKIIEKILQMEYLYLNLNTPGVNSVN